MHGAGVVRCSFSPLRTLDTTGRIPWLRKKLGRNKCPRQVIGMPPGRHGCQGRMSICQVSFWFLVFWGVLGFVLFLVSFEFISRKICQQSRNCFSLSCCCFCSSLIIFFFFFLILYFDLSGGLITRKICQEIRNFFPVVVAVFVLVLLPSSSSYILILVLA